MAVLMTCRRSACRHRTRDPIRAGWVWMEAGSDLPLRTGWWCPDCIEGLRRLMEEMGVQPVVEPLQ
jgi:hypothetical protein